MFMKIYFYSRSLFILDPPCHLSKNENFQLLFCYIRYRINYKHLEHNKYLSFTYYDICAVSYGYTILRNSLILYLGYHPMIKNS